MQNPIIVLETKGKGEFVDYVKVHLFESYTDARNFVSKTRTGYTKYWTNAQIIESGEETELIRQQQDESTSPE